MEEMEEINFFEIKHIEQTTLAELDSLVQDMYTVKQDIDLMESGVDKKKKTLDALKQKIDKILEAHNKKSYDTEYGKVIRTERRFFTVPKEYEKRHMFFDYLKDRGEFDALITVNHQTLNGWASRLVDEEREQGNTDFKVPGLAEPTVQTTVSLRGKK